jgi:hypothetical protein
MIVQLYDTANDRPLISAFPGNGDCIGALMAMYDYHRIAYSEDDVEFRCDQEFRDALDTQATSDTETEITGEPDDSNSATFNEIPITVCEFDL